MPEYQSLFEGCVDSSELDIHHAGPLGGIGTTNYVYKWFVKDLAASDKSMLLAKKLQGTDISIIRRELWEVQHLIDHKRFIESDTTIEDLRKLGGIEDRAINPVVYVEPLDVFGESLVQTGFTKLGFKYLVHLMWVECLMLDFY